jgi:hypothetical protein
LIDDEDPRPNTRPFRSSHAEANLKLIRTKEQLGCIAKTGLGVHLKRLQFTSFRGASHTLDLHEALMLGRSDTMSIVDILPVYSLHSLPEYSVLGKHVQVDLL